MTPLILSFQTFKSSTSRVFLLKSSRELSLDKLRIFNVSNIFKSISNNTSSDLLYRYYDYRTGVRELAAYLALDGKGISFKEKTNLLKLLIKQSSENNYLSTQELSWIVLAINSITGSGKDIDITVDGLNVNNQSSFLSLIHI